jgi:hypothetical protein
VINLEWDTWIVFIQNPASFWISRIVSDAQCGKGVNHISDLVDSNVLDGQPCRRSVMSLPIHLIRIVHQWEGLRSVRCSKRGERSVRNTPAKSSAATALSAHHAYDPDYKTIDKEAAHKPRLHCVDAKSEFRSVGRLLGRYVVSDEPLSPEESSVSVARMVDGSHSR